MKREARNIHETTDRIHEEGGKKAKKHNSIAENHGILQILRVLDDSTFAIVGQQWAHTAKHTNVTLELLDLIVQLAAKHFIVSAALFQLVDLLNVSSQAALQQGNDLFTLSNAFLGSLVELKMSCGNSCAKNIKKNKIKNLQVLASVGDLSAQLCMETHDGRFVLSLQLCHVVLCLGLDGLNLLLRLFQFSILEFDRVLYKNNKRSEWNEFWRTRESRAKKKKIKGNQKFTSSAA